MTSLATLTTPTNPLADMLEVGILPLATPLTALPYTYVIYTDGSCLGNPGPGGWAALILDPDHGEILLRGNSNGESVTNNRMEMTAVVKGLEHVPEQSVLTIYSDSQYIINCFTKKWYVKWLRDGWQRRDGRKMVPVLNIDLWQELLTLIEKQAAIQWHWVKAHAGHIYNERVDRLALAEAERSRSQAKR